MQVLHKFHGLSYDDNVEQIFDRTIFNYFVACVLVTTSPIRKPFGGSK